MCSDDAPDDDVSVKPQDAKRVARRALVLSAVVCRSFSDHDPDTPDAQDLWTRLCDWVRAVDIESEIEPRERELIFAPLGSLSEREAINGQWHTEGLAILAWALGLHAFPSHDQQLNPFEVTDSLWILSPDASELIDAAKLRSTEEISACRELLYAIHCRLRGFHREQKPCDIRHWIQTSWLDILGIKNVLDPDGDLRIGDVPIWKATDDTRRSCESVINERHRAVIWVVGEDDAIYSKVRVDT